MPKKEKIKEKVYPNRLVEFKTKRDDIQAKFNLLTKQMNASKEVTRDTVILYESLQKQLNDAIINYIEEMDRISIVQKKTGEL